MAIEATLSRYKKNNMLMIAGILIAGGVWFYYDGYKNPKFIEKHTKADQSMDHTLIAHRYGWPILVAGGVFTVALFAATRNRKVIADEQQITMGKTSIPFSAIEKINKTHFDKKGYFIITYNDGGKSKEVTLSERTYDNLAAVLDHTVAKIK
jgi:hypothetical protein